MEKRIKNLCVSLGILFSATLTAYHTTKTLLSIALDRDEPDIAKKAEKILPNKKNEDYGYCLEEARERLKKREHVDVAINSFDGYELVGHYIQNEKPERVIIAMHGWRSSWDKDFAMVSDFWINNGCSILLAEERGQNSSGGEFMGFGMLERFDCASWIEWVIQNVGGTIPIYLAGVSMGASTVLMASGLPIEGSVNGIIADCGYTSAKDIWKYIANNDLHISYNMKRRMANYICREKINMDADEYTTLDALSNTTIPVLFIHGASDNFVPVTMTYENYESCKSDKDLLIVPGADHCMSYFKRKEKYEKITKEFWDKHDVRKEKG